MLDLSSAILNHLNARGPRHAELMVRLTARERDTGNPVSIGFWTGADHQDFTIEGQTDSYFAAGSLLSMDPLTVEAGLNVRTQRLIFSGASPEFINAVNAYEPRGGAVRIYVAFFDPDTKQLIDAPVRRFKGKVAGLTFSRDARTPGTDEPATSRAELSLQSNAEKLTNTLALKKSDVALRARAPGDAFRQYTDISGAVETVWGEERGSAPSGSDTPTPSDQTVRESPNR